MGFTMILSIYMCLYIISFYSNKNWEVESYTILQKTPDQ